MLRWRSYPCAFLMAFVVIVSACGEQEEEKGEAAIRQKAKSYENAFNQRDAKALAALWDKEAEYVDPETGKLFSGRDAIEGLFQADFQDKSSGKMEIKIDSITFPNKDQAIEIGTFSIKPSEGAAFRKAYKATYVKRDGEWLIAQVREVAFNNPPSQYEHLKELEWLIGEWVDQDEDATIMTTFEWDRYKNFITQKFTVTVEGQLELEGRQIIAWDPINKRIRSWIFDSDGTFGEGAWKQKEDSWLVESVQTFTDGRRASSINIYTSISRDKYRWESTGREIGGVMLPNLGPITVVRTKG